ncbi:MAG: CotH kinase family protein, partial [Planctomycetes bacterium]|nr:CotH kinase family protein [Planctomycetota bacterium]
DARICSPGLPNGAAMSALPPFVSHVRRHPQQPRSEDAVWISARVRGEGLDRVVLHVVSGGEQEEIDMRDDGSSEDGLPDDGVFGAAIAPRPHNTPVTFRVEASSPAGSRLFPPASDPTGVYGYYVNDDQPESGLPVYTLVVPSTNPRSWIASLSCTTYRDASFACEGDLYYNVGIRRRGQSVCGDSNVIKKFLKIRFQRGREFRGMRKLNLQSLYTDKSLIREHLAWRMFAEMGAPYCFQEFVRLHANGSYFGLYAELEHPDQFFLERNGLDPEGNLYKAVASREERTGSTGNLMTSYEKKTNEDGDFSDLAAFLNTLHSTPAGGLASFFEAGVDCDAMIDYQAAQVLTNNRDYPHKNHYLYHDVAAARWMPITWDMDLTFGKRWDGNYGGVLNDLMDNPGITPWYTTNVRGEGTGNHLLDKFFSQAGTRFRRAYLVRLWSAIQEKYREDLFEEKILRLRELLFDEQLEDIAVWGRSSATRNDPSAPAAFDPNLDRVRQHIRTRRAYLINYLRSTERFTGHDRLKITELMYNPPGSASDGEYLELWNNSGSDIDVSGWTVEGLGATRLEQQGEDVVEVREDYFFPAGTLIAADEIFVLAKDPESFRRRHGDVARVFGPYPGELSNSGQTLRVKDAGPGFPATVDFLRYGTDGAWPSRADGLGYSLELTEVAADRDNDLPEAWRNSLLPGGTPGRISRAGDGIVYFSRGDVNGDGVANISDAVGLLLYLFAGRREPPCLEACDTSADEKLGIDDGVVLLRYLFAADGTTIPSPGPGECLPSRNGFCRVSNCEPSAPER